ncbi:MAG: CPBP family intramembrane metalloprotease [Actinobacteria bacterium]|nr:CPBP family intramembrane metalloprotease [Actinomycetota bacterium]
MRQKPESSRGAGVLRHGGWAWRISARGWIAAYAVAIGGAEVLGVAVDARAGAIGHAAVLFVLLNHRLFARGPLADVVVALALVPLLRLLSVTIGFDVAEVYQYGLVGAPLLLGVAAAARALDSSALWASLRRWSWLQLPVALSGVPLGLFAYLIARPDPIDEGTWRGTAAVAVLVFVFSGVTEELLFRWILQQSLVGVLGAAAPLGSSVLFAIVYLDVRPAAYAAFVVAVGIAFGVVVARTRSVLGVAIAHGLLAVGAVVLWPGLLS